MLTIYWTVTLFSGARVGFIGTSGDNLLFTAIRNNDWDCADLLLKCDPSMCQYIPSLLFFCFLAFRWQLRISFALDIRIFINCSYLIASHCFFADLVEYINKKTFETVFIAAENEMAAACFDGLVNYGHKEDWFHEHIEKGDINGNTALHAAVISNCGPIVAALIRLAGM